MASFLHGPVSASRGREHGPSSGSSSGGIRMSEGERGSDRDKHDKPSVPPVHVPADFDLESFISPYSGINKIRRLLFVGERALCINPTTQSHEVSLEAYARVADELKKSDSLNILLLRELNERFSHLLSRRSKDAKPSASAKALSNPPDQDAINTLEKKANQQNEILENELNSARVAANRENIRLGLYKLANFLCSRGDPHGAIKTVTRTKDFNVTPKHQLDMYMFMIKVLIQEMGNFQNVVSSISKAESLCTPDDKAVSIKLEGYNALINLDGKRYRQAAAAFTTLNFDLSNEISDILSTRDIAIYGGLTGLVAFDRNDLKIKVIDNVNFKSYLDMVPEVRDLIEAFYSMKYAQCFKLLDSLKTDLLLDIYLHEHVKELYQKIRNKAMMQYTSPYTSIELPKMAEAFNTDLNSLMSELATLITNKLIDARIDSNLKRLYAQQTDPRNQTFQKALEMGDQYQKTTKALILHLNLMKNEIVIRPNKSKGSDDKRSKMMLY